jgi:hypothetical protein
METTYARHVSSPPRWYPDPARRHQLRYRDGGHWTEQVIDNGVGSVDPVDFAEDARHVYVDARLSIGLLRSRRCSSPITPLPGANGWCRTPT